MTLAAPAHSEVKGLLACLTPPQLAELLELDDEGVFLLATCEDDEEMEDIIRRRVIYLAKLSKLVTQYLGATGFANWLLTPHESIDNFSPMYAFSEDWEPSDAGPKILLKLAALELKRAKELEALG